VSFMFLPIRGVLAFFVTGWWGVVPMQVLDGIGTGLQTVAVPGMVARSLDGTGRINLGQGAVITVQGVGASLSVIPIHASSAAQPPFLLWRHCVYPAKSNFSVSGGLRRA